MTDQEKIFLSKEGDAYFRRNRDSDAVNTGLRVMEMACERLPIVPEKILEIGCGTGAMLEMVTKRFSAVGFGLDPSVEAISEGKKRSPHLRLDVGVASDLPFESHQFDCVIFGFCLYLCNRDTLFKVAAEADRVLCDNGILLIIDFEPPIPYRNAYHHCAGVFSYKMDYREMFLWNPCYSLVEVFGFSHSGTKFHPEPDERISISTLYKSPVEKSFLVNCH